MWRSTMTLILSALAPSACSAGSSLADDICARYRPLMLARQQLG